MNRREFLRRAPLGAAATACGSGAAPEDDGWERGPIRHLLPTVSYERIRLKASFAEPLDVLADDTLPDEVVSAGGLSESFGSLRYGGLCEALLYDCRRHLRTDADPGGPAGFVPPAVERWLVERSERSDAAHLAHVPSTPLLWRAGKWAEWYPEVLVEGSGLNPLIGRPLWSEGWRAQHDRLLSAAAVRRDRTPLFVGGDLHTTAAGRILRAGHLRLEEHPAVSPLCGSLGTGGAAGPRSSAARRPGPRGRWRQRSGWRRSRRTASACSTSSRTRCASRSSAGGPRTASRPSTPWSPSASWRFPDPARRSTQESANGWALASADYGQCHVR